MINTDISVLWELPPGLLITIAILSLAQIVLLTISLVSLARFTSNQIAGLSKGIWIVIILFGQFIGSTVFLVMLSRERSAEQLRQQHTAQQSGAHRPAVAETVSNLYQ